jgi:predicted nucleotidyltransferase
MKELSQKRNLNKIVRCLAPLPEVKAVILYGSFARGDFGPKSDLDVFIVTGKAGARNSVLEALTELDLDRRIQPTVRSEAELRKTDVGLLQNILEEGKVIYLKAPMEISVRTLLALKPFCIFTFELGGLDQKTKARFNREMYETSKGSYTYGGLLRDIGGEKLSRGCIMIPIPGRTRLLRFFKKYKITPQEIRVWR